MAQQIKYLTWLGSEFTGAYHQEIPPEHAANSLEVNNDVYKEWTAYIYQGGQAVLRPPPSASEAEAQRIATKNAAIDLQLLANEQTIYPDGWTIIRALSENNNQWKAAFVASQNALRATKE